MTNLEISFPVENDGFSYYSSISINSEYRKYYRNHKKQKKLILDLNKLAKNRKYYSISGIYPSRNHQLIAYGEDTTGRREYSVVVKDIKRNKVIEKNKCLSAGNIIWNEDSSGYFYLRKDRKTLITDSLYFHKLNSKNKQDRLIYREKDKQFNLSISLSRTKKDYFWKFLKQNLMNIEY